MKKCLMIVLSLLCGTLFGQNYIITAVNNPADGGLMEGLIPLQIIGGIDFESGDLASYAFDNTGSDYPWVIGSNHVHAGSYSMNSTNHGVHNTESFIEMTVNFETDGFVEFFSKISSQRNRDYGRFFIDGTQVLEETGNIGIWESHFFEVSGGTHTFRWLYHKDGSGNLGEDRYFVDDIVFGLCNYAFGQTCTLTATSNEGYTFVDWTENGEIVSTEATIIFTVTRDRSLMANYRCSNSHAALGTLAGVFSVGAEEQIRFSQGNLQYIGNATTPYWKFAEHQWDCLDGDMQAGDSPLVNRDRFGWGTSGYDHGAVCYQPWSNSSYYYDYYAYGQFDYDLCDQTGMADWGYNPILNGGNIAHSWRTLEITEWVYLLYTRVTNSGVRFAKANVNNVNGVVLLPDDWEESNYPLNNTNKGNANYNTNMISSMQWNALELQGAVFLPVEGNAGSYWSASYENANEACRVEIGNGSLYPNEVDLRPSRHAVRLVRSAQDASCTIHLENGWAWFSAFVEYDENTLDHLKEQISAANPAAAIIKAQNKYVQYANGQWFGNLTTLDNTNMYMVQLDQPLDVTLTGFLVNPEAYPITLQVGWQWIGFLSPTTMSIEEALSNLTPNEGDVIKGQNGFATYTGNEWTGSLKNLLPGKGYMYQNNGTTPITFTYPSVP